MTLASPSAAELVMPLAYEKYVELHCTQTMWAFLVPLTTNILVLLACTVLAFLNRKLPENFNESWYIFLSVTSTLLTWSLLLPTYFTSFYAYNRAAILAFCLLVNVYLTIACQYGPKVYAVLLVKEENMRFTPFTGANTNAVSTTNST